MNRVRLLVIWLLCLAASAFAAVRMFYAIWASPQRAWVLAISHDQLANAAANGDPDKTISHRANVARSQGRKWGCILCRLLDYVDTNHCENSAGT